MILEIFLEDYIVENNVILNMLKNQFFILVKMLEKIIDICPNDLWNSKKSGFIFWQQLMHTFAGMKGWLREEKMEGIPFSEINGKKIYPEFEHDPEIILTKEDVFNCFNEVKIMAEEWFFGKNDEWLKSPYKIYNKITNFDMTIGQFKHIMYHIGYCEAIFRENGIETGEYIDYYG
jgi:NOL1/NOP2/fmu family ribosome biogenesis protein